LTEIALKEPGIRIAVFAKDGHKIHTKIKNPLIQSGIAREEKHWPRGVAFKNGTKIRFIEGKNLQDFHRSAGLEFDVIAIYDAQDITENEHDFITTMNRTMRKGWTPRILYTARAGGVGHQWIKRLFIDKRYKEHEKPSDYRFIKVSMQDNPYLRDDEEYQRALGNLPEDVRKAMLEMEWEPTDAQAGEGAE
jgi:phage terminase large subunit